MAETMQQDATVTINWFRINVPTIVVVVVAILAVGKLFYSVENMDAEREKRSIEIDKKFSDLGAKIEPLSNIPYRTEMLERSIAATNERMDRLIEGMSGKLDKMLSNQSRADTKIEVMSAQFEDLKKTLASKIVWKETSIVPLLRYASLGECSLPEKEGFSTVRAYYRKVY